MTGALQLALWAALAIDLASTAYLFGLATIAILLPGRRPPALEPRPRLAIIVPAHNEEQLLPYLLQSLADQTYDQTLFEVHVIADNCTDSTAQIARSLGATVHERQDPARAGKGQAIAWVLDRLPDNLDGLIFLDADSTVEPAFVESMSLRLASGARAVQASYRVAHAGRAPLLTLRALAFALMHDLRGRAKSRLGVSVGIWGNGFAIATDVLKQVGWTSYSVVEDMELHLNLVLRGIRVDFAPEARVFGYMPETFGGSTSQQRRWESGRLVMLARYWRPLLGVALRKRSLSALVVLFELALPPLSVLLVLQLTLTAFVLAFGSATQLWVAGAGIGCLAVYVAAGIHFTGLPLKSYSTALLHAPFYILWKFLLYARELVRHQEPAVWVRTSRD